MSVYYLGNDVDVELVVKDDEGLALQDATTIVLTITLPNGTTVTPTVTHDSTGMYSVSYGASMVGHFTYVWQTTGPNGKVFGSFDVVSGQRNFSGLTLRDLIDEVLNTLHGQTQTLEQLTWLTGDITDSDLSLMVDDAEQISRGLIEIDGELMWVASADRPSQTVTIAPFGRGFRDTEPAAHLTNAMVMNNPRFPRQAVMKAIQATLGALYPDVFQILTDESNTANPVVTTYGLPNNCDTVISVDWQTVGPTQLWKSVNRWTLEPNADPTAFPTGKAINIFDSMFPGRTIKVSYIAPPGGLDDEGATLSETGLADSVRDVLVYGACYRLLASSEGSRLQVSTVEQQGRDNAVSASDVLQASRYFFGLFQQALQREAERLQKFYPTRSHLVR